MSFELIFVLSARLDLGLRRAPDGDPEPRGYSPRARCSRNGRRAARSNLRACDVVLISECLEIVHANAAVQVQNANCSRELFLTQLASRTSTYI